MKYRIKLKTYPVTGKQMYFTQKRVWLFFWRDVVVGNSGVYHSCFDAYNALVDGDYISLDEALVIVSRWNEQLAGY